MIIIRDYWKKYLRQTTCMIIQLVCFLILIIINLGKIWGDTVGTVLIVLFVINELFGIWSLADTFLFVPNKLKKQLSSLPEKERNAILAEYPEAKRIEAHSFLNEWLVVFRQERIYLLRYTDIITASKHRSSLKLTAKGFKKPICMSFYENGENAVVAAFIKSKNPDVKFSGQ